MTTTIKHGVGYIGDNPVRWRSNGYLHSRYQAANYFIVFVFTQLSCRLSQRSGTAKQFKNSWISLSHVAPTSH